MSIELFTRLPLHVKLDSTGRPAYPCRLAEGSADHWRLVERSPSSITYINCPGQIICPAELNRFGGMLTPNAPDHEESWTSCSLPPRKARCVKSVSHTTFRPSTPRKWPP